MENGIEAPSLEPSPKPRARPSVFHFVIVFSLLSPLLNGCASPSEPLERKPVVAQKITDLTAAQAGNDVVLNFTLPTETVDRRPLTRPLSIEIYRGVGAPGAESQAHMTLLATIPSGEVDQYASQGRMRYVDSLKAEDFGGHDDLAGASYSVRTRASVKKDSDPSNVVYLQIRPAFEPIVDLKAQVTQSAIVLTWTLAKTLTGSMPPVAGYHIYRGESSAAAAAGEKSPIPPLAKIGETESPTFQDTQFEFGSTYVYSVRSVVGSGTGALESSDSNLVTITPRDTFPPAAPTGLVVALVPKEGETPAHFELSWAISPETDVAGYNVYRSEQAGTAGTRLNSELLLTPAFRDMNVEPGHRYFYTVTAVDRSGNESPVSEAVSGGVPAENR
jgi:predicted phage tail protein